MEKPKATPLHERLTTPEADAIYGPAVTDPVKLLAFDREMAELGDKMIAEVMALFDDTGIDLDYSEESLDELDALIGELWHEPIEEDETLDAIVSNWGAYIGLVIRQHLGGEWVFRQDLEHTAIRFPRTGLEVFPLHMVRRRFLEGAQRTLLATYEGLVEELTEA